MASNSEMSMKSGDQHQAVIKAFVAHWWARHYGGSGHQLPSTQFMPDDDEKSSDWEVFLPGSDSSAGLCIWIEVRGHDPDYEVGYADKFIGVTMQGDAIRFTGGNELEIVELLNGAARRALTTPRLK